MAAATARRLSFCYAVLAVRAAMRAAALTPRRCHDAMLRYCFACVDVDAATRYASAYDFSRSPAPPHDMLRDFEAATKRALLRAAPLARFARCRRACGYEERRAA